MNGFEQQWQRRFEKFATRHQSDHLVSGWSLAGLRKRLATFERLLDEGLLVPGARALELGCGAGTYVRLLAKRGHPVTGLDYSLPSLVRAAAADPARAGRYVAGSAYALPFPSGAFRAVICIGVLQALEQPSLTIGEIARVLRPGGVVVVETLNPRNPVATARRLAAFARRQSTRLRYGAPRVIERAMAARGIRPVQKLGILLPPRSVPHLEGALGQPWLEGILGRLPGVRAVAAHAFWIVGVRE
ncbi:MAG TPA: class I SAM-dependent methyltransferase [Gemmatimonadales bacterium]|nr:class I SAM-dependent methyltransferase [Gemmatimonadales bacterium]